MAGTLTVSAEFQAGTEVSLVERTPACREAFQVEYTPDPRQPGVRLQKPPSELPVTATATADEQGVTRFVFDTFAPFEPPRRRGFWAIGWDPLGARWKRVAATLTLE
jgi:hypothetical protein